MIFQSNKTGMVCSFMEIYLDQIRDLGAAFMADRRMQMANRKQEDGGNGGVAENTSGAVRTGASSKNMIVFCYNVKIVEEDTTC